MIELCLIIHVTSFQNVLLLKNMSRELSLEENELSVLVAGNISVGSGAGVPMASVGSGIGVPMVVAFIKQ